MSRVLVCLVLLLVVISERPAAAQWIQTNGPYGATVTCSAAIGGHDLLGTPEGMYVSTNIGQHWTPVRNGIGPAYILSITVAGNQLYACTWYEGVFRSEDSGSTWQALSSWPKCAMPQIVTASNALLLLTNSPRMPLMYVSTNEGASWQASDSALLGVVMPRFVLSEDSFLYAFGQWVIRSSDLGRTWEVLAVPPADVNWGFNKVVALGQLFFAICQETSDQRSELVLTCSSDLGRTWERLLGPPYSPETLTLSGTRLLFGSSLGGIYYSDDSMRTVHPSLGDLPATTNPLSLDAVASRVIAGYGGVGAFCSKDAGSTWFRSSEGLLGIKVHSLTVDTGRVLAATNIGLFIGDDLGQQWQTRLGGLEDFDLNAVYSVDSLMFAGVSNMAGYCILRSADGGSNWTKPFCGLVSATGFIRSGETMIASGNDDKFGGIWYSVDAGITWTPSNMPSEYYNGMATFGLITSGKLVLAATDFSAMFSSDEGRTWSPTDGLENGRGRACVGAAGSKVFYCRTNSSSHRGNVYVANEFGGKWYQAMDTTFPPRGGVTSFAGYHNAMFAATDSCGIYLSTDYGSHWWSVSQGLSDSTITSLAIRDQQLFATTVSNGVWRRDISEMLPLSYVPYRTNDGSELSVYPNPSMESIEIRNAAPYPTVLICDRLGRAIRTLRVSGDTLDISTLAPGIYWLRIGSQVTSFVKN